MFLLKTVCDNPHDTTEKLWQLAKKSIAEQMIESLCRPIWSVSLACTAHPCRQNIKQTSWWGPSGFPPEFRTMHLMQAILHCSHCGYDKLMRWELSSESDGSHGVVSFGLGLVIRGPIMPRLRHCISTCKRCTNKSNINRSEGFGFKSHTSVHLQDFHLHEFGDQLVFCGGWNLGFSAQSVLNNRLDVVAGHSTALRQWKKSFCHRS
jgi:hypothetical protein